MTAIATSKTTPCHPEQGARGHDRKHTVVWTTKIALAAVFFFAAAPKVAGMHTSVDMFAQMGAGQWLRYFVGAAELAGAIGLFIPRLAGLAATGLAADMVGASIVNIVVVHSGAVVLTIALCIVCLLIARNHWALTKNFGCRQTMTFNQQTVGVPA